MNKTTNQIAQKNIIPFIIMNANNSYIPALSPRLTTARGIYETVMIKRDENNFKNNLI